MTKFYKCADKHGFKGVVELAPDGQHYWHHEHWPTRRDTLLRISPAELRSVTVSEKWWVPYFQFPDTLRLPDGV